MYIAPYYNDHQTACTLMIDDFSPLAISTDGHLGPHNDWGYLLDQQNSLYEYFKNNILTPFPDVKGTLFFPITAHLHQNQNSGYKVFSRELGYELKNFFQSISSKFDIAFHGTTHGKYKNPKSPEVKNNWIQEFEYLKLSDVETLKNEIKNTESSLGIKLSGGKYPGYQKNKESEKILESLGFSWWCSTAQMINKKHPSNLHSYLKSAPHIIDLPTNISGNIFNSVLKKHSHFKNRLRLLLKFWREYKIESYLQYLYENRFIISIQEHFQNQRTDGVRQVPNIYDDTFSLQKILSHLRGHDIWYATCSEIAHYKEVFDHTTLKSINDSEFRFDYSGNLKKPKFTLVSSFDKIQKDQNSEIIKGVYKNSKWIFNKLEPGHYKIIL